MKVRLFAVFTLLLSTGAFAQSAPVCDPSAGVSAEDVARDPATTTAASERRGSLEERFKDIADDSSVVEIESLGVRN